jgi:uncharacterized protein
MDQPDEKLENRAQPDPAAVRSAPNSESPILTQDLSQDSVPNFAAAAQPSYLRTLFLGPEGLRPGWGLALYFVMFVALKWVADKVGAYWNFGGPLRADLFNELTAFVTVAIPALVMARVERRPWEVYGLPPRRALGKLFWVGAVWGFMGITLLLAALHGLNAFDFGHVALHGVRIAKYAAYWGAMFLLVGLFEEFLFRGYTQFSLGRGVGFWPAALVMSCGFGGVHWFNSGESLAGVFAAGLIGLFFCLTLRRTGSLWFAVGFHAAWDWGETFFYSVPDSGMVAPGHLLSSSLHGNGWLTGGSVGPEGSLLCFVVIGVLSVAFDRVYRGAEPNPSGLRPATGFPRL